MNWYLLHVYTGQEDKAESNLITQGFSVYNPQISVERSRKGKISTEMEAAFRGYLFVELDIETTNVLPIASTKGCIGLVKFGHQLALVPTKIITRLQESLPKQHIRHIPQKGDKLLINNGPFKGLEAIYIEPDGEKRSNVLIKLLDRKTSISIDNNQIL